MVEKDSEEIFLTLLQRIQRQYAAETPNSAMTGGAISGFASRPPDEAAAALGRQLAISYQDMVEEKRKSNVDVALAVVTGDEPEPSATLVDLVPGAIQEKALATLCNRYVNPSVPRAFFSALIGMNSKSRRVSMEWLPSWICYCDQQVNSIIDIEDDSMTAHSTLEALTATIQAYASYKNLQTVLLIQEMNDSDHGLLNATGLDGDKLGNVSFNAQQISSLYQRLETSIAKMCLTRELTRAAFANLIIDEENHSISSTPAEQVGLRVKYLMSPIVSSGLLSLSASTSEAALLSDVVWRESWSELSKIGDLLSEEDDDSGHIRAIFSVYFDLLQWLTKVLECFIWSINCRTSLEQRTACKELGNRWLIQILELGLYLSQLAAESEDLPAMSDHKSHTKLMSEWLLDTLSGSTVYLFTICPSYRISMEPAFTLLQEMIDLLGTQHVNINLTLAIRISTIALATPIKEDVRAILMLLSLFGWSNASENLGRLYTQGILKTMASIFLSDEICGEESKRLLQWIQKQIAPANQTKATHAQRIGWSAASAVQLLCASTTESSEFIRFISKNNVFISSSLSSFQQSAALLLGVGLVEDPTTQDAAYSYLENILGQYPHLGISLLPVVINSINRACIKGDSGAMMKQLTFLCEAMSVDSQCAKEIWNVIGIDMMKPSSPPVIRAAVIRLFPALCAANKRLYKRIIDVLGKNLSQQENIEVRLAVAATLSDMAREDRIRDVSEIVGWIQGFIVDNGWVQGTRYTISDGDSPGNAALVYYAINTLHYLVVAQELDYPLVLVVLNKKLANVHEIDDILKLPPLVIESLALLLGDGECSDESDEEAGEALGVPPHVSRSVDTLVQLANSDDLNLNSRTSKIDRESILRIQHNIHISLSRYTSAALGIDEDGIREVTTLAEDGTKALSLKGVRYNALKKIVDNGISIDIPTASPVLLYRSDPDNLVTETLKDTRGAVSLASKVMQVEEDVLGSSLWQKRAKLPKTSQKKTKNVASERPDDSKMGALPSSARVQQAYNESRSPASSLAALLCFEGKPLSLLSDLASDIVNESSDPFFLAFTVQGWISSSRQMISELQGTSFEQIVVEIRHWSLENPDNMYMALSSLCLYSLGDTNNQEDGQIAVANAICDEIFEAYSGHEFDNDDIGKLCLGIAGTCSIKTGSLGRLEKIIAVLEKSVSGYGGGPSFGAFYGLSMIAQSLPTIAENGESGEGMQEVGKNLIARIVSFLVSELVVCITGKHTVLTKLVKCINDRAMKSDIIDSLVGLRKKPLSVGGFKRRPAKCIFIGFALCLPALTSVNEELLLGCYCLLECIQWGNGKGLAMPSALKACLESGIFNKSEMEKIYGNLAEVLEDEMNKGSEGQALADVFYAVTALMKNPIPDSIRRFLVGNQSLFDEDGRAFSILAAIVSLSSLPCLGCGAVRPANLSDQPALSPAVTKDDIERVIELISQEDGVSGHENQLSLVLVGFLASLRSQSSEYDGILTTFEGPTISAGVRNQLPVAQTGTVLEVILSHLSRKCSDIDSTDQTSNKEVVRLLECLEGISLPGHFAAFLEELLQANNEAKMACLKLLSSQLKGRPRAVFDGRELSVLASQIATNPTTTLRVIFGQGDAALVFLSSIADMMPRFPTGSIEDAIDQLWRFCITQVNQYPLWTLSFLTSFGSLLRLNTKRTNSVSPKTLTFFRQFLSKTIFVGIRDATTLVINQPITSDGQSIYDAFVNCLSEIPTTMLAESEFFSLKELDGFAGESLRYRCIMSLTSRGYFTTPTRASSEISSSIAWLSRQLISSENELLSSALLRVACTTAEATANERPERKREILLSMLDNLLLAEASAGSVGLQILGILVGQWQNGRGVDGDLSLACLCVPGMQKWQAFSPTLLQKVIQLLVNDLPYNLSRYGRQEKMLPVIFNRLWRIYNKFSENGTDQETLDILWKTLACCRSLGSGEQEFASMAISKLL